jgi:hypothetical protein
MELQISYWDCTSRFELSDFIIFLRYFFVFGFSYFTIITAHLISAKDVAFHAAIVAETLLPGRDAQWGQRKCYPYILMGFLHQEDRDAFQARWNSLANTKWYNSDSEEFPSTVGCTSPHARRCVLPLDALCNETGRITDILVASGIPHADRFELTEVATQSKLSELRCLADRMGIKGFRIWTDEDYDDAPDTSLLLTFSADNDISGFMKATQQLGFI